MFTEDELNWLRESLSDYKLGEISPTYYYWKDIQKQRKTNKKAVRDELEIIRQEVLTFTPEDLMQLKSKKNRTDVSVSDFSGIYIIHNLAKDIYYIGQSVNVFNRVYLHFTKNTQNEERYRISKAFSLPEIYHDYCSGEEFHIDLIPLESTSFSSLNELEGSAIIAYNSEIPNGYNRVSGNIRDKAIFKNETYEKAAKLLLNRVIDIKGEGTILELTNSKKRTHFTVQLIRELQLPNNASFIESFRTFLQDYRRTHKK